MVAEDRLKNPPVVQPLKVWWEQTNNVPRQKVNKDEDWANGLTPFHHLWGDYDDTTGKEVAHADNESDGNEPRGGERTSVSTIATTTL
jgi:hypothetical protein